MVIRIMIWCKGSVGRIQERIDSASFPSVPKPISFFSPDGVNDSLVRRIHYRR